MRARHCTSLHKSDGYTKEKGEVSASSPGRSSGVSLSNFMTDNNGLEQANVQLNELIQMAKSGALIPVRLPRQLEAIATLLEEAKSAQHAPKPPEGAALDTQQVLHENAEFFKTAIHELRTPMTSIRGYADMLSNPAMVGELSDMQKQLLQVIRTNSKRMESLLSDMSYINKVRAGILSVNAKIDMFKNIAMIVQKKMEPVAEELKRTLEFDIPAGLPVLNTDADLLSQAMIKLVENSLRYSAEDTGKATVRGAADGNTLVITIEDNGIGMSAEELAKLGTLYYRSDNDIVRSYKGSGLGVPIAYGLIKALEGTISVTSTQGQGTTFTIRLPGMS